MKGRLPSHILPRRQHLVAYLTKGIKPQSVLLTQRIAMRALLHLLSLGADVKILICQVPPLGGSENIIIGLLLNQWLL